MIAKTFLGLLTALSLSVFAGSWNYNINSGLGIYVPEGWGPSQDGRATTVTGPVKDTAQSRIFLGSDWITGIHSLKDLNVYLQKKFGSNLTPAKVSALDGFRHGSDTGGEFYVFREDENVILIEYAIRGSAGQRSEAKTMLDSVDIRTGGIGN